MHKLRQISLNKRWSSSLVLSGVVLCGLSLGWFPHHVEALNNLSPGPGYNGKIAYVIAREGNQDIYTMDPDGSNQTRLTDAQLLDVHPMWSPDGSKLLFTSTRDDWNNDVYVMDADGSNQTRLTDNAATDSHAHWSPDGTKILFVSTRDGGDIELYVMNPDGSNQTRLTESIGDDWPQAWSPDGRYIYFLSNRDGHENIYVMNADGSNQTKLTTFEEANLDWLTVSPDGTQLSFTVNQDGDTNIYAMGADGADLRQLTQAAGSDFMPVWSPDGASIVFVSLRHDNDWEIYTMNPDGSNQVRLTESEGFDHHPNWSPDGEVILFHSTRQDGNELYRMDRDGSDQTRLTFHNESWTGNNGYVIPQWYSLANQSPLATPDSLITSFSKSETSDVLANDTDEEFFDPQYLTIATQPDHGTATVLHGKIRYTPSDGFHGSDALTYQICDSFLLDQQCATGVLAITVAAPNAPTATLTNVGSLSFDSSTNSYQTAERRPTFSGTADPLAEIRIEIHSDPIILTATADEDGNWSVTPDQDLPVGEHTVSITATNDGVTTVLESFVLAVVTAEPRLDELPATGATAGAVRTIGSLTLALGVGGVVYRRWRTVA